MTERASWLSLTERRECFERRHPGILLAAPWATPAGKWEVSVPDHAAVAYDSGRQMIDDLEARYSSRPAE
jgi:hypothetical protein